MFIIIPLQPVVVRVGCCMFISRDKYSYNDTEQNPRGGALKFPNVSRNFIFSPPKQFSWCTSLRFADMLNRPAPPTTVNWHIFEKNVLKQHDNEA